MKKSLRSLFLVAYFICPHALAAYDPVPEFDKFSDLDGLTNFLARPIVANSPCKNSAPSQAEMLSYLNHLRSGNVQSKKVSGAALKDDRALLELFGKIHNKDPRSNKEPWRYSRGATVGVPARCKEVLCAMQSLYGNELGIQMLYMRAKFGFNSSHLAMGEGDMWPSSDMGTVLAMLEDMPDSILPINEGMRFLHMPTDGRNGEVMVAESLIHVYSPWHNLPVNEKTTSLAHELGHVFGEGKTDTPEWLNLSGWIKDANGRWIMGRPETAVLDHAKTNPIEDFAETFFMYRYNGAALKRRQPEKYQYMKDYVFKSAEYISTESCAEVP